MRYDVSHSRLTVPECFADCRGGVRCPRGDRVMHGRRCRDVLALRLLIISACRFAVYRGHHAQSPH